MYFFKTDSILRIRSKNPNLTNYKTDILSDTTFPTNFIPWIDTHLISVLYWHMLSIKFKISNNRFKMLKIGNLVSEL